MRSCYCKGNPINFVRSISDVLEVLFQLGNREGAFVISPRAGCMELHD